MFWNIHDIHLMYDHQILTHEYLWNYLLPLFRDKVVQGQEVWETFPDHTIGKNRVRIRSPLLTAALCCQKDSHALCPDLPGSFPLPQLGCSPVYDWPGHPHTALLPLLIQCPFRNHMLSFSPIRDFWSLDERGPSSFSPSHTALKSLFILWLQATPASLLISKNLHMLELNMHPHYCEEEWEEAYKQHTLLIL